MSTPKGPEVQTLFRFPERWVIKTILAVLAILWLALIASTWSAAEAQAAPPSSVAPDDEYSFNWLDPDKKIYVLQNRKFQKANHLLLSGFLGTSFSNPYRTTINFEPRLSYYFSESWGIEVFYTVANNSKNNTYNALENTGAVLPVIREINSQLGGMLQWAPWYSKINVFNTILYFDWYFSAGVGSLGTSYYAVANTPANSYKEDLMAFYGGTGQIFHVSQQFVVRWDLTGAFYNALYDNKTQDKALFSNYNFGIGIGLKL
jgi:outer membrane beta-barrel protein